MFFFFFFYFDSILKSGWVTKAYLALLHSERLKLEKPKICNYDFGLSECNRVKIHVIIF